MRVAKPINLLQLREELAAAGVAVPALGQTGDVLHGYGPDGSPAPLPETTAAVVAAHEALPGGRDADRAAVLARAADDPAFAALARLLGLA